MMIGRLSGCIEIDLRTTAPNQAREVQMALDGIEPGDVVKILVSRYSDKTVLGHADLSQQLVQISADSKHTQTDWFNLLGR